MLPHGHPPLVTQVEHVPSLLLPPLSPPVRSSMLNGNNTKPVSDFPVGCPDAKSVQVWCKIYGSILVVSINLSVDPVNFLQLVLVARVGDLEIDVTIRLLIFYHIAKLRFFNVNKLVHLVRCDIETLLFFEKLKNIFILIIE